VPQLPAPWDPAHVRQGYTPADFRALLEGGGFRAIEHRDCFFGLTRALMHYWRKPWVRFGRSGCPYLPRSVVALSARLDKLLRLGKPWDLVVLAVREDG
jgi:hypothetical protein